MDQICTSNHIQSTCFWAFGFTRIFYHAEAGPPRVERKKPRATFPSVGNSRKCWFTHWEAQKPPSWYMFMIEKSQVLANHERTVQAIALQLTADAPENMPGPKRKFIFQVSIFGTLHVSFFGGVAVSHPFSLKNICPWNRRNIDFQRGELGVSIPRPLRCCLSKIRFGRSELVRDPNDTVWLEGCF